MINKQQRSSLLPADGRTSVCCLRDGGADVQTPDQSLRDVVEDGGVDGLVVHAEESGVAVVGLSRHQGLVGQGCLVQGGADCVPAFSL